MSRQAVHVLHVITGLQTGGAETMLARVVRRLARDGFRVSVLTLTSGGILAEALAREGIHVVSLGMESRLPTPAVLWRLRHHLRTLQPEVVQGWLAHGNLVATLGTMLFARRTPLLWNVRQALYDVHYEPLVTRLVIALGARLSRRPVHILYNSSVSARQHEAAGYEAQRTRVIPNGFDLARFRPNPAARAAVRNELGVPGPAPLIGLVARYHPMKDHATFLAAARQLAGSGVPAHFLLAGQQVDSSNAVFRSALDDPVLGPRLHLLGERTDTERLYAAMDIGTLSSYTEAFPNVLGEAMACGTPCVATDVGEARSIIGETGIVVPARDPAALASAWADLLARSPDERRRLGAAARARVEREWSLEQVGGEYAALYRSVTGAGRPIEVPATPAPHPSDPPR